jgi:hypothetical protein
MRKELENRFIQVKIILGLIILYFLHRSIFFEFEFLFKYMVLTTFKKTTLS